MARSAERTEFLGDIITTAVEGGTGYWAQCSQYQYEYDGEICVCVGTRSGDEPTATLHELKDDDSGYEDEGLVLTLDNVAAAFKEIIETTTNDRWRKTLVEANRTNDAGDLDSGDCDAIAQVALLGEQVYA
jgi:hypothetical protein